MTAKVFVSVAVLAAGSAAQAQIWNEIPDAPDLPPGQMTVGVGALVGITGDLSNAAGDFVDMYCIHISDPAQFSATTTNAATTVSDTQVWLFTVNGIGVTYDDDDPFGGTFHSRISGTFVPGPGDYLLAISAYNTDPFTAGGALIWNDSPYAVERAPDGPGAPGPVAFWGNDPFAPDGHYQIDLTGAQYCQAPAPASAALLGVAGAFGLRRRRR